MTFTDRISDADRLREEINRQRPLKKDVWTATGEPCAC